MRRLFIVCLLLVSWACKPSAPVNTTHSEKSTPREEAKPEKESSKAAKASASNAPDAAMPMKPMDDARIASSGIAFGKIESKGALSSADIAGVFERSMAGLEFCYDEARKNNPTLAGKMKLSFVIGVDGSAGNVDSKDSVSPELDQCIEKKVSQMKFPANVEKTEVSYPLLFTIK